MESFGSTYTTPGWQRAQANRARNGGKGFDETGARYDSGPRGSFSRKATVIEGELIAKSTGTNSEVSLGDRVFHQKFGYGHVAKVDGNKLTIAFEKAGEKKVVDSFVTKA